jgi:hypothetical protein
MVNQIVDSLDAALNAAVRLFKVAINRVRLQWLSTRLRLHAGLLPKNRVKFAVELANNLMEFVNQFNLLDLKRRYSRFPFWFTRAVVHFVLLCFG